MKFQQGLLVLAVAFLASLAIAERAEAGCSVNSAGDHICDSGSSYSAPPPAASPPGGSGGSAGSQPVTNSGPITMPPDQEMENYACPCGSVSWYPKDVKKFFGTGKNFNQSFSIDNTVCTSYDLTIVTDAEIGGAAARSFTAAGCSSSGTSASFTIVPGSSCGTAEAGTYSMTGTNSTTPNDAWTATLTCHKVPPECPDCGGGY